MPLFQSIVDTLANTFHQKEQKIEQVLENEKYNENRCYLGTSGVGMITLAKQHLADHACLHCYTDTIEALSSGIDFSQYNLDPFSYKAEWREDTIYCITIIVKDYLRIDITEQEMTLLCQKHDNMLDLFKEIESSAYFLGRGKMTQMTDEMRNILFAYQNRLKMEKDSGKQYNYHVPYRKLSHNEKMHSIEFLTRMAILVYSLMNKEALVVVDCSVGGGTEMLPIWADQHVKRWVMTNNSEMIVGMDSIYLFKLHYYVDTGKYTILEEHLEKYSHLMSMRKKKEYQMMSLWDKQKLLSIKEYIKLNHK